MNNQAAGAGAKESTLEALLSQAEVKNRCSGLVMSTDFRRPVRWGFQISRQSAHDGGKVVSPTHRPSLYPTKYSWDSFLLEAVSTPRPWCGQKDCVNENFQWHHLESNQRPSRIAAQCRNQLHHCVPPIKHQNTQTFDNTCTHYISW